MVAALYVEPQGAYYGLPDVDPWDEARDARKYAGPYPVVAHPPCERWGRFWHGSTRKPHQFKRGDDGGCFAAALSAVREFGGVLEHPADSAAWGFYNLNAPSREGGWQPADWMGGLTCYVEQGFYGHLANKGTWLYYFGRGKPPELRWGRGELGSEAMAGELPVIVMWKGKRVDKLSRDELLEIINYQARENQRLREDFQQEREMRRLFSDARAARLAHRSPLHHFFDAMFSQEPK